MRKRIVALLCCVLLCATMLCPLCAFAETETPPAPGGDADMTLHYQKNGVAFPDLEIAVYRVAEALSDGKYELIEPFASLPVNISDVTSQAQWTSIADTLSSCVVSEQVTPDRVVTTDATGTAYFRYLERGLYLVREVTAEQDDVAYEFQRFLIYTPTPLPDHSYDFSVEAYPKCTEAEPAAMYRVTVLWQDEGYESARPESVNVNLYKNGLLHESVTCSPANNWTYTWNDTDSPRNLWEVAEEPVPEGYAVSMRKLMGRRLVCDFTIINTYRPKPTPSAPSAPPGQTTPSAPKPPSASPSTGGSFSPLPWVLLLCFSGIMLVILGIRRGRRR